MRVEVYTLHDDGLDADLDVMVYGTSGHPVIVLPDWDFSCTNWENGGMIDAVLDQVQSGDVQLFCTDSTDASGWFGHALDPAYRLEHVEAFLAYVEMTLMPFVAKTADTRDAPLLVGAGIGALNATLLLLRHPERYGGLLALSAPCDARALVSSFDEAWEQLSPVDVASSLPKQGKVVRTLRGLPIAFVCGQDAGEVNAGSQRALDTIFAELGIDATFEYWGYDVGPDWVWWQEQVRQLLPCLLRVNGLVDRQLMRRVSVVQIEVDHASEMLSQCESARDALRSRLEELHLSVEATAVRHEQERKVVAARAAEAERLAAIARDAWAERERIARLLDEAQEAGDAAQAAADAAAGELATAEWICGEAKAEAEAAKEAEAPLAAELDEAEAAVVRAAEEHRRVTAELDEVNATVEAERKEAETARRRASARRQGASKSSAKTTKTTVTRPKTTKSPAKEATATKGSSTPKAARGATRKKPAGKQATSTRRTRGTAGGEGSETTSAS